MNPRGTDEKPDEPEPARPSECLEAESTDPDIETQVQELLAIGRRCAVQLREGPSAANHGDLLYDENGIPN